MAQYSIAVLEKPMQHLALSDWHSRVNAIRNVGDARRKDAFDIRQSASTLCNESRVETNWENYTTNEALFDRVRELTQWLDSIKILKRRIETEIKLLQDEKASTERELDALQSPFRVISECLNTRDGRLSGEITYDDVDLNLKSELEILENNQRMLVHECQEAWEKLTRLEELKNNVNIELEHVEATVQLDASQLDLNKFSSNITLKTKPTRTPKNSCTYESWKEHTRHIKDMVETELSDTYALREALFVCREKARNMLHTQQQRTEHTLRKRIFETQRVRNELEWQKSKMRREIEKAHYEIQNLEQNLRGKSGAVKLVETRLENRAQRPGMELCLDAAHTQLCKELEKLQAIKRSLKEKIDEAKANFNLLEDHATKIDVDLEKKEHSLMIDIRTLDLRKRLEEGEFVKKPQIFDTEQTARNIALTKMENEIPKA